MDISIEEFKKLVSTKYIIIDGKVMVRNESYDKILSQLFNSISMDDKHLVFNQLGTGNSFAIEQSIIAEIEYLENELLDMNSYKEDYCITIALDCNLFIEIYVNVFDKEEFEELINIH